ncbi:TerB family tellurite resistance protein [Magnetospira sp. QH-2]|uniref:tellurite resistance TerB family protein n=1 Tax=Magnetospira sp. (strain QH-2) TaxID=1288970 RepID=UPI0003E815F3|nr:TerB family tellurite resistance protein [Magnetospira sp. QH-2]CCQ74645.1 conserved protein of unknown function [Magnetospira sp. QH-2]
MSKLETLFAGPVDAHGKEEFSSLQIAVGALLVKAAMSDAVYHEKEKDAIHSLLGKQFNLDPSQVVSLLAEVDEMLAGPHGIYSCSMVIMDELADSERERLAEMIWDVVYADGVLHDFEEGLMQRLAPLLDIEDDQARLIQHRASTKVSD